MSGYHYVKRNRLVWAFLSVGIVVSSLVRAQDSSGGYVPFPRGYGYMTNIPALQGATDRGDRKLIREHAWKLWAGIMQPDRASGWPLWYTWPNTNSAFVAPSEDESAQADSTEDSKDNSVQDAVGKTLKVKNRSNAPKTVSEDFVNVVTTGPTYDIPQAVIDQYPSAICEDSDGSKSLCGGTRFLFNGDIMVPTESLSQEAWTDLRERKLYLASTLDKKHEEKVHQIEVTEKFIVTKHMYWPVKATGITGIPVWKNNYPPTFTGYAGYEVWETMVGLDPSGEAVGENRDLEFLYGIKNSDGTKELPPVKAKGRVYGLESFYHHKITQEDWDSFVDGDKAILNAASYWANNQPIGVGDYLITIAMHVNTKELPSWTLQSVWWSDEPNRGRFARSRPSLPNAQGPWDHYHLTDDYAVPPNDKGELNIAVNPYIEGVIHPIATSCRNCHVRAGWPAGTTAGTASYQNPDCAGLLTYLTPKSSCLEDLTLTDYLWIIPDQAVADE